MLRDEAVDRIKRRLLRYSGGLLDADIVNALKDAQERLEQEQILPWFLITEVSSILTTIGEERLPIPTNFLRELDQDALWYYNPSAEDDADKWVELWKEDIDDLRGAYPGEGPPVAYSLVDGYFRLGPTPDDNYTIKMMFFGQDDVLNTNVENKWLKYAAWWIIGEAGADIAYGIGYDNAGDRFAVQAEAAKRRVFIDSIAREEAGRQRIKGGPN